MEHMKRIGRTLIHKGAILDFYEDEMLMPTGKVAKWDFLAHKGAAAVLAVKKDGKILMVRQYRPAQERETLEIPAGARDYAEEPTMECAARELEEETGYRAGKIEFLMTLRTGIAYCNEIIDIYLATELETTHQHLDEEEFLEIKEYDLEELCRMIYEGKIQDAKTVSAVLAYKNKYQK
ncbi:ADP-ribose pyrophosphatase [Clostridiales bacterium CHKCI001]|nr:ADP-ribose pyrophosphatase [Clostridiales bacterium CHKCI001]